MNDESLNPDAPYSLTDPGEQRRRLALLDLPHMVPLTRYLGEIKLLERLIKLLSQLRVVILIGDQVRSTGLKVKRIAKTQIIPTPYPFISTFNMRDDAKEDVLRTFVSVAEILDNQNH